MKLLLAALLMTAPGLLNAQQITDCDREVAHPSDPNRVTDGKSGSEVFLQKAIPACRKAIESDSDNPRLHYQLGRALVYWADINQTDTSEGVKHVKIAAEKDYPQAMFVLGLLYKRDNDFCAAEPWTKGAADLGLKSARISYVNDFLGDKYKGCTSASAKEMAVYLEAVSDQVNGYYENMLLGSLKREFEKR